MWAMAVTTLAPVGSGGALPYGSGAYGYGAYGTGQPLQAGGFVILGPQPAKVLWQPETIYCSTPSNTLSQFFLYRNGLAQAQQIAATLNGNADQVPYIGNPLSTGEFLVGQWVGGDSGAQATMTITGTQKVPGYDNDTSIYTGTR